MACPCTFLSLRASCSWSYACRATNRPSSAEALVYPWVSLPGATSVPSDDQAGWHRGQSANPLWLLVLLGGRSRGVLVHFAFTCVLEYLQPCSMVCAGTSLPSLVFPRRVQRGLPERQLLEIRVALRQRTRPASPDKSRSRASSSQ